MRPPGPARVRRRLRCPLCGRRWWPFREFGGRADAQCRRCGSLERHRAQWLYLSGRPPLLAPGRAVLHIAPEDALERRFRAIEGLSYATCDLERADVDIRVDVTRMPFEDERWDLVLCSHVLEHVVDDRLAMRELLRVTRPGGLVLVLVPLVPGVESTVEDPSVVDPAERLARYGQPDHVRIYAPADLTARLRDAGFEVDELDLAAEAGREAAAEAALMPQERAWACRRP